MMNEKQFIYDPEAFNFKFIKKERKMIKTIFKCDKCGSEAIVDQPGISFDIENRAGYRRTYLPASIDLEDEEREKLGMLLCSGCNAKWLEFSAACKAEWTKQILSFFKRD